MSSLNQSHAHAIRFPIQDINIFLLITQFQNGLPLDLGVRMAEMHEAVLTPLTYSLALPPDFRRIEKYPHGVIDYKICLSEDFKDSRFALHLAIIEGEFDVVKRLYRHKPRLFTPSALSCALYHKEYKIALWLYPKVNTHPEFDKFDKEEFESIFDEEFMEEEIKTEEWCRCADMLGLPLAFKQGQILEKHEVAEFLRGEEARAVALKALETRNFQEFIPALHFVRQLCPARLNYIMSIAIHHGDIQFIKKVAEVLPRDMNGGQWMNQASWFGHVHVLNYFHEHSGWTPENCNGMIERVVEFEYIEVLRWVFRNFGKNKFVISRPCEVKQIEIAQLLHENNQPLNLINPQTVKVATFLINHQVEITEIHLRWAFDALREGCAPTSQELVGICKLYHNRFPELVFTEEIIQLGCKLGAVEFIQFIHETKIANLTEDILEIAIKMREVDIVKYLHEVVGLAIPNKGLAWAIESVELNEFPSYSQEPFSSSGDLLVYLVGKCPWKIWEIEDEPARCPFEVLEWLIENCEDSQQWEILPYSVRYCSVGVLDYVLKRTCACTEVILHALVHAIRYRATNVLSYLWELVVLDWEYFGFDIDDECEDILQLVKNIRYVDYDTVPWDRFIEQICKTVDNYVAAHEELEEIEDDPMN